ncbi:hypothetical protein [Legionella sp. km772]|uniref:hypothetical protein n=1 Tax=Legionella sp. km772 TaxID=2498111 RepID=UPI000F8D140E|nr:hypothetical protein [Legionella sp. km772]RUR07960.1 hypothetical protein ELY15_11595 [Legionella sp. km772]
MKLFISSLLLVFASLSDATSCLGQAPLLKKSIENWEIIADNTARINLQPYFSGDHLIYAVSYQKLQKNNKVQIDPHSGLLLIDAQKKDNFDLKITAKNNCGKISARFNVQIDKEE